MTKYSLRIPAVVCLTAAAVLMTGCSAPGASQAATTNSPAPVKVDEGLLTVDITMKRSLLDPEDKQTDQQIIQGAKDKGITAIVNANQTVTYTMSRLKQREMLDSMKKSLQESNTKLVDNPDNSVSAIDFSDDLTKFTVKVDGKRYNQFEAFAALGFYIQGGLYQQFSGVAPDNIDVVVEFVDDNSGKVLNTGSYKEWAKKAAA